ncbi:MAG: hypothetical protein ACRDT8_15940 [Micromonosporaceae bacterium]
METPVSFGGLEQVFGELLPERAVMSTLAPMGVNGNAEVGPLFAFACSSGSAPTANDFSLLGDTESGSVGPACAPGAIVI